MNTERTLGLMGALPEEIHTLQQHLKLDDTKIIAGRTYYYGACPTAPHIQIILTMARVGKVAAASTATTLLQHFAVDEILFTGVAGSAHDSVRIGDVVIARDLWQHDLDATPIFKPFEIPYLNRTFLSADTLLRDLLTTAATNTLKELAPEASVHFGDIVSGDQFVTARDIRNDIVRRIPSARAIEMEGAAVAQVCFEHEKPFAVIRTISDDADEKAPKNFKHFLNTIATPYAENIVQQFLSLYAQQYPRQ